MKILFVALVVAGYLGNSEGFLHRSMANASSYNAHKKSLISLEGPTTTKGINSWTVTLIFYSGLGDRSWEVKSEDPLHAKIAKLLKAATEAKLIYGRTQVPAVLGYKGFFLYKFISKPLLQLVIGDGTKELQTLLFESMPDDAMKKKLKIMIENGIKLGGLLPRTAPQKKPFSKRWAPPAYGWTTYSEWSLNFIDQDNNNCYNYANDKKTFSMALPGRASVHPYPNPMTDAGVLHASEWDGLVVMNPQPPVGAVGAAAIPTPDDIHTVALLVATGVDFHWYRLDDDGMWSHKPGKTSITNLDGVGAVITDPRTAQNNPAGPCYQFVAFMHTNKNRVTIA